MKRLLILLILLLIPQAFALNSIYPFKDCIAISTDSAYSEQTNGLEIPINIYDSQNILVDKGSLKYVRGQLNEKNYSALLCYNKSFIEGIYTVIIKPDSRATIFKEEELNKTLYLGFADCEIDMVYNIQKDKATTSYNVKIINTHNAPMQFNPGLEGEFGSLEIMSINNGQLKDWFNPPDYNHNYYIEPNTYMWFKITSKEAGNISLNEGIGNFYGIPISMKSEIPGITPSICKNIKKTTYTLNFPKKIHPLYKLIVNYERLPKVSYVNDYEDVVSYSWEKNSGDNIRDIGVIYYKYVLDKLFIWVTLFSILLGMILELLFHGIAKLISLINIKK